MQNQPMLDINSTQSIECQECGGLFFDQTFILRKVSMLYTNTGKDEPLPIPVFICHDCHTPLKAFFPNIPDVASKLGFLKQENNAKLEF